MSRKVLLAALLALLPAPVLAQAAPAPVVRPPARPVPVADVYFQGGAVIRVQGPAGTDDYAYGLADMVTSPAGDLKALQWCWESLKFSDCQVQLVTPRAAPVTLKNSSVRQLLFTPDGQWLVGMGDNTLRLWNPQQPEAAPRTKVLNMNGLERLEVAGKHICVTGRDRLYAVYTVLSWPDLKVVREQRVQLLKDASTTTRRGNTETTILKYQQVGSFTPPICGA